MKRLFLSLVALLMMASLLIAGCTPSAPAPTPTKAPAVPTKAAEPTKPAAAAPAPTKAAEATKAPTSAPTAAPAKKVDYPQKGKAITLIIPYPPGGTTDIGARLLGPALEKDFGVPIELVNKGGAATQIGVTELARAKPDGYTIGFIQVPSTVVTYLDADRKAVYTRKDFAPVAMFLVEPVAMMVKADSPYKGVKDVVDAAKANPGKLKVGTASLMGAPHLAYLAFEKVAGAEFGYVHFDGGGPAQVATLGGHVDIGAVNAGATMANVKSGALRMLGIMDKEESKLFPGVKTFEQQGYKIYQSAAFGICAPTGTPAEIVNVLTTAIKKAMDSADLGKKVDEMGQTRRYMDPATFSAFWAESEPLVQSLMQRAKETSQ